jgi:hypothetical protein
LDEAGGNWDNTGFFTVIVNVVPGPVPQVFPRVYGFFDIVLAGAPTGRQVGSDRSPLNSPVQVLLPVSGGQVLEVLATGRVTVNYQFGYWREDRSLDASPNGGGDMVATAQEFGFSRVSGPRGALVGVFLGSETPQPGTVPPEDLDFHAGPQDLIVLTPKLRQPFYIGSGKTGSGENKEFVAPEGGTRLFLGVLDEAGGNWDNTGFFTVIVNVVPGPVPQVFPRVYGFFDIVLAGAPTGRQVGSDRSPLNSPVQVLLPVSGGQVLEVLATGRVTVNYQFGYWREDRSLDASPNGGGDMVATAQEFGFSRVSGPRGALIGVFLGPDVPQPVDFPPDDLDFSGSAAQNQSTVSPKLRQPFYIGSGKTSSGENKKLVAPQGATRLFLAVLDGAGENWDNTGFFIVAVR